MALLLWFVLVISLISAPAGLAQDVTEMATEIVTEKMTSDMTTGAQDLIATTTATPMKQTTQLPVVPTTLTPTTIRVTTPETCPEGCQCDPRTRIASCTSLTIDTVPTFPSYITTLTLTGNVISKLEKDAFSGLTDLLQLYLVSCRIEEVEPGAFNGLDHLRILHLRYNQILNLGGNVDDPIDPSIFIGLGELEELDLRNNGLSMLGINSLAPLKNLETLLLDSNDIEDLQADMFRNTTKLAKLSLKNLDLGAIPSAIFQNTRELKQLEISGNDIAMIPSQAFSDLSNLKELVLSAMATNSLDDNAFQGLGNLKILDLSNNDLKTITKEVLTPLTSLEILILSLNEWHCDCQMFMFVDYIKATNINYYASPWNCITPNRLTGERVYLIPERDFACVPFISTSNSQTKNVEYDQQAYFECVANGDPSPAIKWVRPDGEEVTATSNIENVYTVLDDSVVIIQHARQEENGMFTCIATNSLGEDTAVFQLVVDNIPTTTVSTTTRAPTSPLIPCPDRVIEEPIEVRAINIKDTSLQLNWVEYEHPMAQGYFVEITKFASQDDSPVRVLIEPATNISYVVDNLIPGTEYIICVDVYIPNCPSNIPYEQCVQLRTPGGVDVVSDLKDKHRNEIIGTVLSVFFGTLLILASIFVILWQYRKPKEYTKYDFEGNKDTALFADVAIVEHGTEIEEEDGDNPKGRYVTRAPSARFSPPTSGVNAGFTADDENSNMSTFKADVHGQNGHKPTANGIRETILDQDLEDIKEEDDEKEEPTYDKVPEEDDAFQMSRLSTVGLVEDDENTSF